MAGDDGGRDDVVNKAGERVKALMARVKALLAQPQRMAAWAKGMEATAKNLTSAWKAWKALRDTVWPNRWNDGTAEGTA